MHKFKLDTQLNCDEHKLGSIFPGQTLEAKLLINVLEARRESSVMMIAKAKELPSYGCNIVNVTEIPQVMDVISTVTQ